MVKPYQGKFKPESEAPYRLSRSKIENFIRCPRCFILDRVHGVSQPSGPPFLLNSAVDALYKKEFDRHRANGTVHPVVAKLGHDFVPFKHEKMDEWRANFTGISFLHNETNLHLFGAVDDIWLDGKGKLVVVDYKATAKAEPIAALTDASYHDSYRRQMEFYQWLLRQNGFEVSSTGYWLYATARNNADDFDQKLLFDSRLIEHRGDTTWVEDTIKEIKKALITQRLPPQGADCEYCNYAVMRSTAE